MSGHVGIGGKPRPGMRLREAAGVLVSAEEKWVVIGAVIPVGRDDELFYGVRIGAARSRELARKLIAEADALERRVARDLPKSASSWRRFCALLTGGGHG